MKKIVVEGIDRERPNISKSAIVRQHRGEKWIRNEEQYEKIKEKNGKHNNEQKRNPHAIYQRLTRNTKCHPKRNSFTICSEDEFINWWYTQEIKCVYCGFNLQSILSSRYDRLSIDRKDNSRGYDIDNVCISCFMCNQIKNNIFTYEEMLEIGKIIKKKRDNGFQPTTWTNDKTSCKNDES